MSTTIFLKLTFFATAGIPDRAAFDRIVTTDCLDAAARAAIFDALGQIRTYPDRYSQITSSRILRVGTTGDYAPFSFAASVDDFEGIDIDLARDLGTALGAEVVFVRTGWPVLMKDLAEGRYDIAMSGVSITPGRAGTAYFSDPYHLGGKTPIALCERAAAFQDLQAIDRPGVRIVVNPGGTNEQFLRSRVTRATILMHPDNRTIFEEILSGRADLMITDAIEVRLQAARESRLCAIMPGTTLTRQEKGYMMPQDEKLRQAVNSWLAAVRESGRLAGVFEKHLGGRQADRGPGMDTRADGSSSGGSLRQPLPR